MTDVCSETCGLQLGCNTSGSSLKALHDRLQQQKEDMIAAQRLEMNRQEAAHQKKQREVEGNNTKRNKKMNSHSEIISEQTSEA